MKVLCDPGGVSLVVVTWFLFFFSNRVTIVYVLDAWFRQEESPAFFPGLPYTFGGSAVFLGFRVVVILAVISHIRAVCADPGSLRSASMSPPSTVHGPRICKSCGGRWKPPRAHHCRKCKTCIFRMDHHCPWINNCVGLFNQKYFILFLLYTVAACCINVFLLFIGAVLWLKDPDAARADLKSSVSLALSLAFSCFFFFMAYDFLTEQYEAIDSNSTLIESYQSTHGGKLGFMQHIQGVFGCDWFFWSLPTSPCLNIDFEEPVFLDEAVALHLKYRRNKQYRQGNQSRRRSYLRDADLADAENAVEPRSVVATRDGMWRRSARRSSGQGSSSVTATRAKSAGGVGVGGEYHDHHHHPLRFVNMYVRPKQDIGVVLDDDDNSRFVHLTSSSSSSNEEEELEGGFSADDEDSDNRLRSQFSNCTRPGSFSDAMR